MEVRAILVGNILNLALLPDMIVFLQSGKVWYFWQSSSRRCSWRQLAGLGLGLAVGL